LDLRQLVTDGGVEHRDTDSMAMNTLPEPVMPVIYVGLTQPERAALETAAQSAGATVVRIDLKGVRDRGEMIATVSATLGLSPGPQGLDAAFDDFSDPFLLPNAAGYLWIVDGLEDADARAPEVFDDTTDLITTVGDRWRSGRVPYRVALIGSGTAAPRFIEALRRRSQETLDAKARYPGVDWEPVVVRTSLASTSPWVP
jgi:hypothetical protein